MLHCVKIRNLDRLMTFLVLYYQGRAHHILYDFLPNTSAECLSQNVINFVIVDGDTQEFATQLIIEILLYSIGVRWGFHSFCNEIIARRVVPVIDSICVVSRLNFTHDLNCYNGEESNKYKRITPPARLVAQIVVKVKEVRSFIEFIQYTTQPRTYSDLLCNLILVVEACFIKLSTFYWDTKKFCCFNMFSNLYTSVYIFAPNFI